jgi:hypothetical protein
MDGSFKMEQKGTQITIHAGAVPTHGNWEEERSFGQQTSPLPQKQYDLYPAEKPKADESGS